MVETADVLRYTPRVMEPTQEIRQILKDHNAILDRNNGHPVYKFPDGKTWSMTSTPSDHRSRQNDLSDLKRLLKMRKPAEEKEAPVKKVAVKPVNPSEQTEQELAALRGELVELQNNLQAEHRQVLALQQENAKLRATVATPLPPYDPTISQVERLHNLIAQQEADETRIMREAEICANRVKVLRTLEPLVNDSGFEEILNSILPPPTKPVPEPTPAPPPQSITERVQVTRELVFAAIQTFEADFTINNVVDRMVNGRTVPDVERLRIRQSVSGAMNGLLERGQLQKTAQGIGRQQSVWSKVTSAAVSANDATTTV